MRTTTRDIGTRQASLPSHARVWSMRWWEEQPQSPSAGGTVPFGELNVVKGTLTDDVASAVQRQMTVDLAKVPDDLAVGMWVQGSVGIRGVEPRLYDLPVMTVTSLNRNVRLPGGGSLTCEDPSSVLNAQPYEADTSLTGTLQTLIGDCCAVALSRVTDVSGVPNIALPADAKAEFGAGRWDTCLRFGDLLGVQLRFTDVGDVIGRLRATSEGTNAGNLAPIGDPLPGPRTESRWPTDAVVLVSRGADVAELMGSATSEAHKPRPPWYRRVVVTQRMEADPNTSQAQADEMAYQFLRAAIADLETYDNLAVLPAPWLEAGQDIVGIPFLASQTPNDIYYNVYRVRSFTMDLPSLATTVNLRSVIAP